MKIDHTQLICRAEGKISTELDGETVILDMDSGVYLGLDAIGTRVWSLIENECTFQDLLEILLAEYDVESDQCLGDLQEFLAELVNGGLITLS